AAAAPNTGKTQKGLVIGTPQYMAPEQLQDAPVDARTDIFAFGCVLYEMLTGTCAFTGATPASIMAAILGRPVPSMGGSVPPGLDAVVHKCLEKDPERRWQSALDLKAALAISGEYPAPAVQRSARRPWIAVVAASLAIAAAGALAWLITSSN